MSDTEEISVTIDEEADAEESGKKEQARGEDGKFVKADPAVEDLKSQFTELQKSAEADKAGRLAAEQLARERTADAERARKEAASAKTDVVESQLDTVVQGIAASQAEASAAEQAYVAAQEAGNWSEAAKAQRRMAAAEARIVRLDEAKSDLETRKAEAPKGDERREAAQHRSEETTDPVERYIQNRSQPTANWLRAHKDWITDAKKNAKLTAAHYDAVGDGLKADTDEYFEHVETFLGLRKTAEKANGADKSAAAPARRRPSAAPVAQAGGGTGGNSGTEVRLTAGEARAAQDGTLVWNYDDPSPQKKFKKGDVIGIQEMARRKLEGTKQGLYDRTYVEQ